MKRFYEVYLRPAEGLLTSEAILWGGNVLDGWDRLELLDAGASMTEEPITRELGDGTTITEAFKVRVEVGTLNVTKTEYNYLRDIYNNKLADVFFMDNNDPQFGSAASFLRMKINTIAETAGSMLIKLVGEANYSVGAITSGYQKHTLINWEEYSAAGILEGHVTTQGGVPIKGVLVSATLDAQTFEDTTDKDGHYMLLLYPENYMVSATKVSYTFPAPKSITVPRDDVAIYNIVAT